MNTEQLYEELKQLIKSEPQLGKDPAVKAFISETERYLAFAGPLGVSAFTEALYGPEGQKQPRPRRSRRLTVSRPQRAIERGQR